MHEVEQEFLEQAHQFLGKVEKTLSQQEVRVHALVKIGFPGEEILKIIHSKGIDLAVLGTRSYSRASGIFLGSVSQWVLQEAPCSVLIARNRPHKRLNDRGVKLLLPTDGSPDAQAAVDFVNTVGLPPSSHIMIVHVIKKQVYETERALTTGRKNEKEFVKLAEEIFEARGREGSKLLDQTAQTLSSQNLAIQKRLAYGNPAAEILKAARHLKADLIVMGSQGATGVRRMFLDSVSDTMLSTVPDAQWRSFGPKIK